MIISDYKMALASIRSARWRSSLTMLGIIIGISSVVTIASLGEGLKKQVSEQINQLGGNVLTIRSGNVVSKNSDGSVASVNPLALFSASTLTDQDVASIQKLDGVSAVAPMSLITNSIGYEDREMNNVYVVSSTPDLNVVLQDKVNFGAFFIPEDTNENYAVIGTSIAEELFGGVNPVGQTFTISGTNFLVRGVHEPFQAGVLSTIGIDLNYSIIIPPATGKRISENRAQIAQILVQVSDQKRLDVVLLELQHELRTNHKGQNNFTILKQEELANVSDDIINAATAVISGIAAISLIVGGIGIMNTLLVSVSERTREIGIRKAVGATNRQILRQFLMEGLVLSLVGGVVGIALAVAGNFLLRIYTDFRPVITPSIILIALGTAVTIGVIFAVMPALQAARKHPIEALRNE